MNYLRLTILIIVVSAFNLKAQNNQIIIGVYNSSMTYYDIEPDTVLPFGEYPDSEFQYAIDLNFDNKIDYTITNEGSEGLGGGIYGVWVVPADSNKVNYYRIDSVYAGNDFYRHFHVTIPFEYGDTINKSYLFTSDIGYLYYHYWFDGWNGFTIPEWRNLGDRYLGIRMKINDTLVYGWIRLEIETDWGWPKTIIKDYALSKAFEQSTNNNSEKNMVVYPNPATNNINIKLPIPANSVDVSIFDINGKNHFSKNYEDTEQIRINTTNLQSGVYIVRAKTENKTYNLKMIKN